MRLKLILCILALVIKAVADEVEDLILDLKGQLLSIHHLRLCKL